MRHVAILVALLGLTACPRPAPRASATPTHWAAVTGSATSNCSQTTPCTLERAVSLLNQHSLAPGSHVTVGPGVHSHPQLVFKASGTAAAPIRFTFEVGARLSGVRTEPTSWTKVPGLTYTYETAATGVAHVAQRPPVPSWRPIYVDDRRPPFTSSLGRPFWLDFPVVYSRRATIAEVDAQSCTFTTTPDRLLVHLCHDGPPVMADRLMTAPHAWGTIVVEGDYLEFVRLRLEQTNTTGFKVARAAEGTRVFGLSALAAQVWLEGTNTVVEDLDVAYVIRQGPYPGRECYDANPEFGKGECWNAFGDGRALLVGREGSGVWYNQTVRRATVRQSWNGGRVDGPNTLEHATFWGFPNHIFEASGTNVTVRNSSFVAGQDSVFLKTNPMDRLHLEGNTFAHSTYVTTSNDGSGGVRPTGWTLRGNVFHGLTLDRHTFETLASDCNAWLGGSPLLRIIDTNGIPGQEWQSLADLQRNTTLDAHSIAHPGSYWTQGPLFANYHGPAGWPFSFADPLRVCGRRAGVS